MFIIVGRKIDDELRYYEICDGVVDVGFEVENGL